MNTQAVWVYVCDWIFVCGCMCERARDILTCLIIFSFHLFCHFVQDYVRKSGLNKLINAQVSL